MLATAIELSPEQKNAHDAILAFVKNKTPQLRIGGYAGTGKTTLIAHTMTALREAKKKKTIALACFTGKAAFVLREKLSAAGALAEEYCGTIHGLMYRPVETEEGIEWCRRDTIDADLLIIDEASMVNEQIYNDLKAYGVPMLFIGDHGQLPPIGGQLALMQNPDVTLTKIQRQAAENPIIRLSVAVRVEGRIPEAISGEENDWGGWSRVTMRLHDLVKNVRDPGTVMFLCGYNKTRVFLNSAIRDRLGFHGEKPMQGEKLICLKNSRELGIFNGMGGLLKKIKDGPKDYWNARIMMEDGTDFKGLVVKAQFGAPATLRELDGFEPERLRELFDFGYCLSVWKAQGSESDRVVFIPERFSQMDDDTYRRFLYTGITRARKRLTICERIRA